MQIPDFSHITNQNDPVPNVPPHILDFEHPEGELHITNVDDSTGDATMVACPGSENTVSGSFCTVCRDGFGFLRCGGVCAFLELRGWQLGPGHLDPEPLGPVLQRHFVRRQGVHVAPRV